MIKRVAIAILAAVILLIAVLFADHKWGRAEDSERAAMLATVPTGASAVLFADFTELRESPFVVQLFSSAAKPPIDTDYAQFLRETGFDYERDLDRVAVAVMRQSPDPVYFIVADGHFDRKKLNVYGSQFGSHEKQAGHEVFSVPVDTSGPSATPRKASFTFLRSDRIAMVSGTDLGVLLSNRASGQDAKDWRERFDRLAGSSAFAVIRQDAALGAALAARAPGGLQSPQLSSLLDQLQWITVAGKPEGDHLRVVMEGECAADNIARPLADILNGILLMANAGLNGPQIRRQLDPQTRSAYLDVLKSADVSRIDRGETKSVRLMFDISLGFLQAARTALPAAAPPDQPAPEADRSTTRPHKKK
jgi:hypothetical protein